RARRARTELGPVVRAPTVELPRLRYGASVGLSERDRRPARGASVRERQQDELRLPSVLVYAVTEPPLPRGAAALEAAIVLADATRQPLPERERGRASRRGAWRVEVAEGLTELPVAV